jgi:2'-5' RNA ligase
MRLFVAIDCEDAAKELVSAQKVFAPLKARLTKSFHLTLLFIGEVSRPEAEIIKEQLNQVSLSPFDLQLSELGTFVSYSQKVIWCGVQESKPLLKLHQAIYKTLKENDDVHKYTPHITLARIKKHQRMNASDKQVLDEGLKKEVKSCSFQVSRFVLYESTITPNGPVYRVIEEYSL